ncbi:preprotein translocase [Candidatus Saccharibacteria bacterium 32-49-12]|nr:MAG: preprotein translocase [Candidatus Saccharibacteria bacterium 32-49-12]
MRLIDSHCHIHDTEFFGEDRQAIYDRAIAQDVGMIAVGTDERSSQQALEFAGDRPHVWAAVGVHPHEARLGWSGIEPLVKGDVSGKIVAIGEIGLDYFYDHSSHESQRQALIGQLELAKKYNLPVSFHVRDAFSDFWPIFDSFSGIRGVLHSFTDSRENAEKGMGRGLFIGINGISTFTKDESQRELYRSLPLEKVLLETDAPFLTPKPLRGKVNEVGYVELVAQSVAAERGVALEEVCRVTCRNTRELFSI